MSDDSRYPKPLSAEIEKFIQNGCLGTFPDDQPIDWDQIKRRDIGPDAAQSAAEAVANIGKTTVQAEEDISDPVNHPYHYNSSPAVCECCSKRIECIDITRHMSFNAGNVVKYLWRAGIKDGQPHVGDLEKARWYLSDEINRIKAGQDNG